MKQVHIIFAVLMSFLGLNAMSDAPNVIKWQEICKDPQEKQKLVAVYKDFCQKRFKNDMEWIAGSCIPFISKTVRKNFLCAGLLGVFAGKQLISAGIHNYRNDLAQREDLFYLSDDIMEQLGNPEVAKDQVSFKTVSYVQKNNLLKLRACIHELKNMV